MQEGVTRVRLDGGVDGPAFQARTRETQAAQLLFENAEAPVLGGPHPADILVGCGINRAQADQQVPEVTLEARGACPGEDTPHAGQQGGSPLTVCRCGLVRQALRSSAFSWHGLGVYQRPSHYSRQATGWLCRFRFKAPGSYQRPRSCQDSQLECARPRVSRCPPAARLRNTAMRRPGCSPRTRDTAPYPDSRTC